jgi:hypothetical protein
VPLVVLPDYPGTREYLLECCSWCTIAVRQPIGLPKEGFRKSRMIRIHVLSDALPLEGVPT